MIKTPLLKVIKLYQLTRKFRPRSCRFYPSCSDYAYGCIDRHGFVRGGLLSIWRVLKCQPLHPGGIDDVPDKLSPATRLIQSLPTKI